MSTSRAKDQELPSPDQGDENFQTYREKIHIWSQAVTQMLENGKKHHGIEELDGVRALACLGVVSFHLNLWAYIGHIWTPRLDTPGALLSALPFAGEMGIILFFILSGFLLFLPYARTLLFDSAWPSGRRFYLRRLFRILPGYYFALGLMLLFLTPEYLQPTHWNQVWLFLTMRMDDPLVYQQINAPFWTLAIEFQFYLFLPVITWGMGHLVRRGPGQARFLKLLICLAGLFAWGILTRVWGVLIAPTAQNPFSPAVTAVLLPFVYGTRGKFYDAFAIGMLISGIYVYQQNAPSSKQIGRFLRRFSPSLFALGLITLGVANIWHFYAIYVGHLAFPFLDAYQGFLLQGYKDVYLPPMFALGYGLCLFAIVFGPDRLKRPFSWPPLRWIGLISYSLYLWHDPFVLYFLSALLPKFQALSWIPALQYVLYLLWIIVTAFPLSIILYCWVERPGIRFGEQLDRLFEDHKNHTISRAAVVAQTQKSVRVVEETATAQGQKGDEKNLSRPATCQD